MNWKTPITLVVLLGLLLGAAVYGWQTIISPSEPDKPAAQGQPKKCAKKTTFKKGQVVRAENIVVNVFNAGVISGQAGNTLSALVGKGFRAGVADNAPDSQTARNVTIVTPTRESPEVRLVRLQFVGAVRVVPGNLEKGIDVVVGDNFRAVNPNAATSLRLGRTITSCSKAPAGTSP